MKLHHLLACIFIVTQFALSSIDDLQQLSIEALMDITVTTGSFLELDTEKLPVTLTVITEDQIQLSGARHLSELLEIYVPGFQYMVNKWNGTIWGMRGVTGDRNDKILLLINGTKQNFQTFHGAASEYTLGLMGDIERIEVLRGPAGLVYGSGAIAGVINVITRLESDRTAYGSVTYESSFKNGIHGKKYEGGLEISPQKDHNISLHLGYRESEGLGMYSAKNYGHYELIQAEGVTAPKSGNYTAGSPYETPGNFLSALEYTVKNFNSYIRFSRQQDPMGSYYYPAPWSTAPADCTETWIKDETYIYNITPNYHMYWTPHRRMHVRDNLTLGLKYTIPVKDDKVVIHATGIGTTNRLLNKEIPGVEESIAYTLGERRLEMGARYLLNRLNKIDAAAGFEFGNDDLGKDLEGRNEEWYWSSENARMEVRKMINPVEYRKFAAFGESNFKITDKWNAIAGVRFDTHTRTDAVWSPKAGIIFNINDDHRFKLITQSSSNHGDVLTYELPPSKMEKEWSYNGAYLYGPDADSVGIDSLSRLLGEIEAPVNQGDLYAINPERSYSVELASNHKINRLNLGSSFSMNMLRDIFLWNSVYQQNVNLGEYNAFSAELDINYNHKQFNIGGNIAVQLPVNLDNSPTPFTRPKFVPSWDTTRGSWVPTDTFPDGSYVGDTTIYEDITSYQVSADGNYFNSLHTITTKFFADIHITSYLTFHSDLRLFWGLWGREPIHDNYISEAGNNQNFLNMDSHDGYSPTAKWNSSLHFKLPRSFIIGVYAYDILGNVDNHHAVRWHQMAAKMQCEYYTIDQRTFALKVTKEF